MVRVNTGMSHQEYSTQGLLLFFSILRSIKIKSISNFMGKPGCYRIEISSLEWNYLEKQLLKEKVMTSQTV